MHLGKFFSLQEIRFREDVEKRFVVSFGRSYTRQADFYRLGEQICTVLFSCCAHVFVHVLRGCFAHMFCACFAHVVRNVVFMLCSCCSQYCATEHRRTN